MSLVLKQKHAAFTEAFEYLVGDLDTWWSAKKYPRQPYGPLATTISYTVDGWRLTTPQNMTDLYPNWDSHAAGDGHTVHMLNGQFREAMDLCKPLAQAIVSLRYVVSMSLCVWMAQLASSEQVPMWQPGLFSQLHDELCCLGKSSGEGRTKAYPELNLIAVDTDRRMVAFRLTKDVRQSYNLGTIRNFFGAIDYSVKFRESK